MRHPTNTKNRRGSAAAPEPPDHDTDPRPRGNVMTIPRLMQGKLSLPVIGSPLFIVSGPDLVIAQCKAGIVGSFPALNARPKDVLEEWTIDRKSTSLKPSH